MRRIYETEWFGIKFNSFANLNRRQIADASFYDKLYQQFNNKFSKYADLPLAWKVSKSKVADFLLQRTKKEDLLLSIGSGIGYIEYLLEQAGREIIATEH